MTDFEKVYSFDSLYRAHKVARLGKRKKREVIEFELRLSENLTEISRSIKNKTYRMSGYYCFYVYDPKKRLIHALHYRDRVVQHALCDEVLAPLFESRLIYDNAACRQNKGTLFALRRVKSFLSDYYKHYGNDGYFLKCDIHKFFDSIDHEILKNKLRNVIKDENILWLLFLIIDSYETAPGKGIPMGNQTSQWFAIFYLDGMDRLIKEQLRVKYYSRYMDDCVLIGRDKNHLKECLSQMRNYAYSVKLEFNEKTKIFPIKNGVDYLGFHIYLASKGKVILKVRQSTKKRFKRKLKHLMHYYSLGKIDLAGCMQVTQAYHAHLSYGHTYYLQEKVFKNYVLCRDSSICEREDTNKPLFQIDD